MRPLAALLLVVPCFATSCNLSPSERSALIQTIGGAVQVATAPLLAGLEASGKVDAEQSRMIAAATKAVGELAAPVAQLVDAGDDDRQRFEAQDELLSQLVATSKQVGDVIDDAAGKGEEGITGFGRTGDLGAVAITAILSILGGRKWEKARNAPPPNNAPPAALGGVDVTELARAIRGDAPANEARQA